MATRHLSDDDLNAILKLSPMKLPSNVVDWATRALYVMDHIIERRLRKDFYMGRPDRWARDVFRIQKLFHYSRN